MARNVEIKARLESIEALLPAAAALADHGPEYIAQDDTFFGCLHGRLKLRVFADGRGELIACERPDSSGPKTSDYRITPVPDTDALREGEDEQDGIAEAQDLLARLNVQPSQLVCGAYLDLLLKRADLPPTGIT